MESQDPSLKPASAELAAWDREFLWHPFTPMKPWMENKEIVVIERGEREYLIDTDGRRYIDGVSSLWCNVHGHAVPELDAAVREQLSKVAHTTLLGLTNVPAVLLGKKLVELARGCGLGLDRVFYSDDGSTAVEVACKMAFQYWRNKGEQREKFVAFESAYHGDTLGAVSVGGIEAFHATFRGLCFGAEFVKWDGAENAKVILHRVEETLRRVRPAGLVIEPIIQGAGGMRIFPPGVLAGVRELCTRHGALLIADEVMTGFGRTGSMFACEHESVTPDLLCLSKGLTAGYMPLGVTMATKAVFEAFYVDPNAEGNFTKTFFHGHTFTGHPLACAVALASLELFERNRVLEHVAEMMPLMEEMLAEARRHPYVSGTRQCGLIGAIDLARPVAGGWERFPWHWRVGGAICTRLREVGVILRPLGDTVVVMPPLAIRREVMAELCAAVVKGLGTKVVPSRPPACPFVWP